MADDYNFQQVVQLCGIPESTISELLQQGLLQKTEKGGRAFLSSQQVYR